MDDDFLGAHVALFLGDKLLVILRDDFAHIPGPNCWDFPGGTREAGEAPIQTLMREEVGVILPEAAICYARKYQSISQPAYENEFYVARLEAHVADEVVLGDEGQRWALMTPEEFMALPNVVPAFPVRLKSWLDEQIA